MGTEVKKMMHLVAFAVLVLECIYLVACVPNAEMYFDEYNKYYKECRELTTTQRGIQSSEKTLRLFASFHAINSRFRPFKDEAMLEAECFHWIFMVKVRNNLEKLMVPFYVLYLANYYTSLTLRLNSLTEKEAIKRKMYGAEEFNSGQIKLEDDLRLLKFLLFGFSGTTPYDDMVQKITELRKEKAKLGFVASFIKKKPDIDPHVKIDEDAKKLNEFQRSRLKLEAKKGRNDIDRIMQGQETKPLPKRSDASYIAFNITNEVVEGFLPGCYLPKKALSGEWSENEITKFLSKVYEADALNPEKEFKEESRIVKIIWALVTSVFEMEASASGSASASASEPAPESASASTTSDDNLNKGKEVE